MRRGFTLIELLVVIAIIAILAAILFPVFARAREKARQSSCLSNTKQIGLAFLSYAQDCDERYPPYWLNVLQTNTSAPGALYRTSNGTLVGYYLSWMDFIAPYVKNNQIFRCPSGQDREPGNNGPSYGYNRQVSRYGNPIALGDVQRPAECMLSLDYASVYATYANLGEFSGWNQTASYAFVHPHNEGGNVAFCDGHSKWFSRTDGAMNTGTEATNRMWNPALP